jgi:hypothetical protein
MQTRHAHKEALTLIASRNPVPHSIKTFTTADTESTEGAQRVE